MDASLHYERRSPEKLLRTEPTPDRASAQNDALWRRSLGVGGRGCAAHGRVLGDDGSEGDGEEGVACRAAYEAPPCIWMEVDWGLETRTVNGTGTGPP